MRRPLFYGWVVVTITAVVLMAFVAAGWIAIVAGFAALAIRRRPPTSERAPSPVAGSAA
jgi:hypothetical protein